MLGLPLPLLPGFPGLQGPGQSAEFLPLQGKDLMKQFAKDKGQNLWRGALRTTLDVLPVVGRGAQPGGRRFWQRGRPSTWENCRPPGGWHGPGRTQKPPALLHLLTPLVWGEKGSKREPAGPFHRNVSTGPAPGEGNSEPEGVKDPPCSRQELWAGTEDQLQGLILAGH